MARDFITMLFAEPVLRMVAPGVLQAIGWVLAVLQAALAVHAVLLGIRQGVLNTT